MASDIHTYMNDTVPHSLPDSKSCELCYKYTTKHSLTTKSTLSNSTTYSQWELDSSDIAQPVDAPIQFGGCVEAPSPLALFLVSASASQQLTMNIVLATDPQFKSNQVNSIKWCNIYAKLNTGLMEHGDAQDIESHNGGTWEQITFVAELDCSYMNIEQLELLISEVERRCPIIQLLLRGGTTVYNNWSIVGLRTTSSHNPRSLSSVSSDSNGSTVTSNSGGANTTSSHDYNRRFEVRAAKQSPCDITTWSMDEFSIRVDADPVNTHSAKSAGPMSIFLTSVASCMQVTASLVLKTNSKFIDKRIDSLQWTDVYGIYDSRALLHGYNTQNNTFDRVVLSADIYSDSITQSELNCMVDEIKRRCPQSLMLSRAGAQVEINWLLIKP